MKDIMEATALVQNVKPVISVRVEPRPNVVRVHMRLRDLAAVLNVERGRIPEKELVRVLHVRRVKSQ